MKIRVVVACGSNASGEPDLTFVIVKCSNKEFEEGDHYWAAHSWAADQGYEMPFIAFDEKDSAGRALLPLFVWKSASVVDVVGKAIPR
jgi:hypothetical protein